MQNEDMSGPRSPCSAISSERWRTGLRWTRREAPELALARLSSRRMQGQALAEHHATWKVWTRLPSLLLSQVPLVLHNHLPCQMVPWAL